MYYSLKWSWQERTDWKTLDQAAAVLSDPVNLSRMVDLESTKYMVCLDNLPPHEIASLMAMYAPQEYEQPMLGGGNNQAALPSAAV